MTELILCIRLFGSFQVFQRDEPLPLPLSPKARMLLAYLVLHHDRTIPRDRLTGLFWPERQDTRARRALSQALWQIRSTLGFPTGRMETERGSVSFRLYPGDRLDVEEFEEKLRMARAQWHEPTVCIPLLTACLRLYRADFLHECYEDWALLERERLRELHLHVLEHLVTLHKQQGDYEQALTYAQRLVAVDPLRESGHRELMHLYHLLGRSQAALAQFATLRRLLADDLGISPTADTVALYYDIAAALEVTSPPHLPVASPPPLALRELARLPLVGREKERDVLLDALQEAVQGRCKLALVEGEVGVGKTRLVEEITADATWRGFQVGVGKANPMDTVVSYGLLTRALVGVLTPLRLTQLAALLEPRHWSAVASLVPSITKVVSDIPSLSHLSPDQQQEQVWEGVAHCIAGLTVAAPLLLLLEDLHWADDASLKALPQLLRRLHDVRLFVIITYRAAEAWERPAIRDALERLDRLPSGSRVRLHPFTADQMSSLVRRVLRTGREALPFATRLWNATHGNPLFVIETLKVLLRRGDLRFLPGGRWALPDGDSPLPVPASIRELIGERLARLSPPLSTVLEWVAVLGEDADFSLIARVSDIVPFDLIGHLRALIRQGLLVEVEQGYRFAHDLIWEIAYRDVHLHERQELHRRVGEALESLYPDRTASLALHFDRGGVPEKALRYIAQAADHAQAVYDYDAALKYYQRALSLIGADAAARWQVLVRQEQILEILGRRQEQATLLDEMLRLADKLDDPSLQARTLHRRGWLEVLSGNPTEALTWLDRAAAGAQAIHDQELLAVCRMSAARAWWRIGDVERCRLAAEEANRLYAATGNLRRQVSVLNMLGNLHLGLTGNYALALDYFTQGVHLAQEQGDRLGQMVDLTNIGITYAALGHYRRSQEVLGEAWQMADGIDSHSWMGIIRYCQGFNRHALGELKQAEQATQEALRFCLETNNYNFEIETLNLLGRIALTRQNLEAARRYFERAVEVAQDNHQSKDWVAQISWLAGAHFQLGHYRQAYRLSEQAIDTLKGLGNQVDDMPDVYFRHCQIVTAVEGEQAARPYLEYAFGVLSAMADKIQVPDLRRSFLENIVEHRAIVQAHRLGYIPPPVRRASARLAAISAPTGRPLRPDEFVEVLWTVSLPEDYEVANKGRRRRQRLMRLVREAAEQSAVPTVADLATALGVSVRTIKRDLSTLRRAGHAVRTRGSRSGST